MREETMQRDEHEVARPPDEREVAMSPYEREVAVPPGERAEIRQLDERPEAMIRDEPDTAEPAPTPSAPADPTELADVWPEDTARGFRERWQTIQLGFVDDPHGATSDAKELLAEVLDRLSETLAAQKAEVDTLAEVEGEDVERLRTAVRSYRHQLERLLGI